MQVLKVDQVESPRLRIVFRSAHGVLTVWRNDSIHELGVYYDPAADSLRAHRLLLDDFVAGATDRAWTLEELGDKSKPFAQLCAALCELLRGFRSGLLNGSAEEFHRVMAAGSKMREELDSRS